MAKEPNLIMRRRFTGRVVESALLVIAVALGVGAAASGLSLLFHTNEYSSSLLKSPEYMEIIVATMTNYDDMDTPVTEKIDTTAKLTSADLDAGNIIPSVSYSYIINNDRLRFYSENMQMGPEQNEQPPEQNSTGGDNNGEQNSPQDNFQRNMEESKAAYEDAQDNPNFIFPDVEEINGREVSSQFFSAWDLETTVGSLFTTKDYTANNNYIILGSELAEILVPENTEIGDMVNKKIITMNSVYTIVGVLEETGTTNDGYYFTPIKELSSSNRFRRGGDDQQLRFAVFDPEELDNTAAMLQEWFDSNYDSDQVVVSNPRAEALRIVSRNRGISVLILFLSMAGLFIASVNVSNILMSRSLRMRKHVGILKALGASRRDVINLFTGEALAVTIMGSILGTAIAIPLSKTMEDALDLGETSWLYVGIGVVLSSLLTLLFSVIPARQNTGIDAAVAMRSAG